MTRREWKRAGSALMFALDFVVAVWLLLCVASCKPCDVAGVFDFCRDGEGPHELIANPPIEWRQRAMDVQRALYAYTKLHSPSDTARFVWRDSSAIIFVRVLKQGIPGACARTDGDSILIVAGNESDRGLMRHEFIHWVQPGNAWLEPDGNIHYPPIFAYIGAPLICG